MSNEITVSLVTPCFNSAGTIRKTIEAVLAQTVPCKEYFIIDGKSTDGTVEIAREYAAAFAAKGVDYRVFSEKDNGIYDAMNKGIDHATGTLVGIINSDDWYEPIAVETAVKTYQKHGFDMMYADLRMLRNGEPIGIKKAKLRKKYITTRDWNHPTTFLTRAMYDIYRYPCQCIYDDLDVLLQVRRDKRKVVIVNEILANYQLGGASNRKSFKNVWNRMVIKYRLYRKNGYSRLYLIEAVGMELGKWILA